jgi:hypothetical protein
MEVEKVFHFSTLYRCGYDQSSALVGPCVFALPPVSRPTCIEARYAAAAQFQPPQR